MSFAVDIAGSCAEIREGYVFCCRNCCFMQCGSREWKD
jgi:hypothetical protein